MLTPSFIQILSYKLPLVKDFSFLFFLLTSGAEQLVQYNTHAHML